jgi:dihydroorotate dehydrogenase electron transfer subunit
MPTTEPTQLDAAILANREVAREHYRMALDAPAIASRARPGQFVMLRPGGGAGPLLPRAYSVYSADPESGRIDVLYRVVGAGTRALQRLHPGETLPVWGPLGNTFTPPASSRLILVGGGVGVPPLVFLASSRKAGPPIIGGLGGPSSRALTALLGAATAAYLVGMQDLASSGAEVRVATDDGSAGVRGFVTRLLEEELAGSSEEAVVCACGPLPMLAAVARICAGAEVSCQLALEAPMACGVGACLGCTVPRAAGGFARVCADGPVFDGAAIDWEALRE